MENFGVIIKRNREEKGWTQKELAHKLHVSDKAISRYETGKGYPDITMLPAIAKTLELNYDELLDGNAYIIKCKKKRLFILKIICLSLMCIFLLLVISRIATPHDRNYTIREKMIQTDNLFIHELSLNYISNFGEKEKDDLLSYIAIDEWKPVSNKEIVNADGPYALLSLRINHGEQSYVMEYYQTKARYIISISNEYYQVPFIPDFKTYFLNEMNHWYHFSNQHHMFISQDFKELSTDEMNWIPYAYSLTKNDLLSNEFTYICDESKDRYYLIICSDTNDITQMTFKNQIIQLEGRETLYLNPYIHIIEIPKKYKDNNFNYNGESIDPLNFTIISYPGKA